MFSDAAHHSSCCSAQISKSACRRFDSGPCTFFLKLLHMVTTKIRFLENRYFCSGGRLGGDATLNKFKASLVPFVGKVGRSVTQEL
jgi:hypothetical protein